LTDIQYNNDKSIEFKYAVRSAYNGNMRSMAKIIDYHLVCVIPRGRELARLVRPLRTRARTPFASCWNDAVRTLLRCGPAPVTVMAVVAAGQDLSPVPSANLVLYWVYW
jgi:hypothetical protein